MVTIKQDLINLTKQELIVLASNLSATLSKVSKLYIKSKAEIKYLLRRNNILDKRLNYMQKTMEKRNGCHITFERIDAIIKREHKEIKKNGNAKVERL